MDDDVALKSGQEVIDLAMAITKAIPRVEIGHAVASLLLVLEATLRFASPGARKLCFDVIRRHLDNLEKAL